jgi:hypothetical protein
MIRGSLTEGQAVGLDPIVLAAIKRVDGAPQYDEDWIQNLIHQYPDLLPVRELEPAFHPIYPVCRELRLNAGFLDNLFVSENGGLVLVECKLWRNPEARREVIGQALDYAKEISRWTYQDLTEAVKQTTKSGEDEVLKAVRDRTDDLDEKTFIDAVSRNLKRGRFLLLIVGDGIREGVEGITNFLQRHAGLDFTFGLVELAVFKVRGRDEFLIQPRILANSVTIERGVIRIDQQGTVTLADEPKELTPVTEAQKVGKRVTISEQVFYEKLTESAGATVAQDLRRFLEKLVTIDVTPVFGSSSLNLRWFPASNRKMNFGSIRSNGSVDTDPANWVCKGIERPEIGEKYQTDLAALIGAKNLTVKNGEGFTIRVVRDGKPIQVRELLSASNEWFDIIVAMQETLAKAVRDFDEE